MLLYSIFCELPYADFNYSDGTAYVTVHNVNNVMFRYAVEAHLSFGFNHTSDQWQIGGPLMNFTFFINYYEDTTVTAYNPATNATGHFYSDRYPLNELMKGKSTLFPLFLILSDGVIQMYVSLFRGFTPSNSYELLDYYSMLTL